MDLNALADRIAEVRCRIANTVDGVLVDEIDKNAFAFVDRRLREMEEECRRGTLKPADKRWPELARIAEETHPDIMSPELGGELIEVERLYQQA